MKYSIIIPTYNKCDELLKPCIESILKYTTLTGQFCELIVVANGCTDNTLEYLEFLKKSANYNIFVLQNPNAMGFTKAVNWGMSEAQGDYFIILNNDTVFLDNPINNWLEILNKPFREQAKVAVTGPMRAPNDATGLPFLLFFCVMISKKAWIEIGNLDEIFSPGYGEDTDYCLRAESMGWKCLQVPKVSNEYYAENRMVGDFPIYHAGNQTFKDHPDAELIHRNNRIIKDRWGSGNNRIEEDGKSLVAKHQEDIRHFLGIHPNDPKAVDISQARQCDGYMADEELLWLGQQAQTHRTIIEVGSWHGKSSRALGDNLMLDGHLVCIDHWRGSEVERDNNHQSANWQEGDHAYLEFMENMWDLYVRGKVSTYRLSSSNAAALLLKHDLKVDMIFIDAGHTYEEVKDDIIRWLPLLKEGGMICGHDMFHVNNVWPGVGQAVNEIFGKLLYKQAPNTSIWVVDNWRTKNGLSIPQPLPKAKRDACIYDCFPYNNEIDVLLERFQTLYDTVDRFIIVEAKFTHAGKEKELTFEKNLPKWSNYINKVTYLVVESLPEVEGTVTDKSWARERYQRDYIMNGLRDCQDDDIIIISDCDEIVNPQAITAFKNRGYGEENGVATLMMDLYYYNKHIKATEKWDQAKITTYKRLKELSPCGVRYSKGEITIRPGGEHLSYFGGAFAIRQKIEDTAHQEYNLEYNKDLSVIQQRVNSGVDIFGRNLEFEKV